MEKGDEEKSTANNFNAAERHLEATTTTTTIAATTQTPDPPSTVTQTACDSIEAAAAADAAIVVATDAVDNEIQASPASKSVHEVSDVEDNANNMHINPNNSSSNMIRNSDSLMKSKNNKNNKNKKISHTSIPLTIIVEELPPRKAASDDKKLPSQHTLNEILRAHSERTNPATAHMQLEPRSTAATAPSSSSSATATAIATANNGDKDGSSSNNAANTGHKDKNTPRLSGIMDEMADDMSGGGGTAAGGGGLGDAVTLGSEPDNEPTPTASIRSIGSFVCRICHNAENPERLVSPCYCKGSLSYVHIHCLERWISTSRNTSCELCQFQYNTEQTLRYSCLQSLRMWYSRAISRRALQEDCQMFSLLTLVAFGIVGTLLVGIQYYFLQGRTWGLGRLWTKGWLVFSLFTTLIVYFINIYMIVRSQLAPWYRWWQSARDIKLILENRKPLEFRPSRRLQNRLAAEVPPTMSAIPQTQQQPVAYHPAAPPPAASPAAASPAASNVETSQPATQMAGTQALRMQFRQQIERAMVVASSELGMYNGYNYNNIKYSNNIGPIKNNGNILQRNRNRNSYNNNSNNIRIHGNRSDYAYMYSDIYNNNNNSNKYNGPFLPLTHVAATAAAAGGADVTLMPPTAETSAGSVVGVAAVEIFLEPNRLSSYSRRF